MADDPRGIQAQPLVKLRSEILFVAVRFTLSVYWTPTDPANSSWNGPSWKKSSGGRRKDELVAVGGGANALLGSQRSDVDQAKMIVAKVGKCRRRKRTKNITMLACNGPWASLVAVYRTSAADSTHISKQGQRKAGWWERSLKNSAPGWRHNTFNSNEL